ncbi:MAG: glycyl-radical enzyme activating protein [Pseudomonadota bacterium]
MHEDATRASGVVFNIQRFSIHDGPGIRTTVFFKGCPLRCGWCSNPESLNPYPEIITRDGKCIRCGRCAEACSEQAIEVAEGRRNIQWEKCNDCMDCAEVCPSGAIEAAGKTMTVAEVLGIVERDAGFYRRSGGGMTLSGGEPLMQRRFSCELLREARKKGVHTALDTSGYADWDVLEEALSYTDLVLFDVKHPDSEAHRQATGVPNERILDNLQKTAARQGQKIWVRYPLIPRFSDSEEQLKELCKLILDLKPSVEKISLLSYHKFGELKYAAMGKDYPWKGISLIKDEDVGKFRNLVESHGIEADVGR